MTTLDDLVSPRSVAVVGASNNPTRIGGRPIAYFLKEKFQGDIYPINPNSDTIQGLKAYPSLMDVPGQIDFVLVAIAAKGVVEVVRQAALKGAKTAMIFSSGFAEMDEEGAVMQQELSDIARETGIRVVGPNCLGMFNSSIGFFATFTQVIDRVSPKPGGLAIASQSGAFGSHIFYISQLRGLDVRYWLTTGNEADVHIAEVIKLLAEKDDVHSIFAYAESIKDGGMLVDALEIARANRKPVVFMKVGRSKVGAEAASSHTASLAGEDAIYDAVLREAGCYRANSTEQALDIAYAARPRIYPTGRRTGLVTLSGGAGVLMADAAEEHGLDVAPMPADAQVEIKKLVPFAGTRNPLDVTAQFLNDLSLVSKFTNLMLDRGNYDGLVGFWTTVAGSPTLSPVLQAELKKALDGREDKLFIHSLVADKDISKTYEEAGFPVFEDPSRAVGAMAAMMFFGEAFAAGRPGAPTVPEVKPLPEGVLGEREAKAVLAEFGLPLVEDILATTADEAAAAATKAGGPVAMKIASPDILHKTDVGGVALGVKGADAAQAAFKDIMAKSKAAVPDAHIDGIIVSPMIEDGTDCILGAKIDPVFGPVVMFGLGGVFTEVMKDVSFRRAPVSVETAKSMISELKGAAILKGARGTTPANIDAIADCISRFSVFAAAHAKNVESIEMNPLRALPDRCIALDALIVKSS